jgi:hypothetical protein
MLEGLAWGVNPINNYMLRNITLFFELGGLLWSLTYNPYSKRRKFLDALRDSTPQQRFWSTRSITLSFYLL